MKLNKARPHLMKLSTRLTDDEFSKHYFFIHLLALSYNIENKSLFVGSCERQQYISDPRAMCLFIFWLNEGEELI